MNRPRSWFKDSEIARSLLRVAEAGEGGVRSLELDIPDTFPGPQRALKLVSATW